MIHLTNLLLCSRWDNFDEFHFTNEDALNYDKCGRLKKFGIPESQWYNICFWRIPEKKKREAAIFLSFDKDGKFTGYHTRYKSTFKKRELKKLVQSAINKLIELNYLEDIS